MASEATLDTLAEFAAINTAIHRILINLAKQSPDPRAFLSNELESGLEALVKTNYWGVSSSQQKGVIENARKRYSDMIDSIHRTQQS